MREEFILNIYKNDEWSIEKLFRWVPEKGPINVSTEKWKNPGEYHEKE